MNLTLARAISLNNFPYALLAKRAKGCYAGSPVRVPKLNVWPVASFLAYVIMP